MLLDDYLAIPYVLSSYSAPVDGVWMRVIEYPELGCYGVAESPLDAMDEADRLRVELIVDRYSKGEEIPVPRLPLDSLRPDVRRLMDEMELDQ